MRKLVILFMWLNCYWKQVSCTTGVILISLFFVIKIEIGYVFVKNILSVLILHIFTHNEAKSHENVLSTDWIYWCYIDERTQVYWQHIVTRSVFFCPLYHHHIICRSWIGGRIVGFHGSTFIGFCTKIRVLSWDTLQNTGSLREGLSNDKKYITEPSNESHWQF